ncbi:MAG: preprotein translocase subunit SecY [Clostridia bacterium]|nr:preprotein translocase subunit SecY [Clostridia bacterium]MBQ4098254.1 preprotein translocase subunit SecY [Clostridia bacterium]
MFETLKQAFKVKEIRVKIYITLALLLVYRIGCYIPVPGIGSELISGGIAENLSYLNIMNMMTGGSLQSGTLFAMGIGPYINSSIIIQLLAVAIPSLERLSKQGEEGRKKISQYTRYLTILLAIVQALGILLAYEVNLTQSADNTALADLLFGQEWLAYIVVIIFFTAGTVITMWIGERITDYGVSNGISLLIFAGILSSAGQALIPMVTNIWGTESGLQNFWKLIAMLIAILVVFTCIVTVELAERKIPVQYAKQIKGNKMYGGQSTVIPIKVNSTGVLPLIFAFSILSFPELVMTLFGWANSNFGIWWQTYMGTNSWAYMVVLSLLIIFFAYFYTSIQFNPDDISKSIQQNGGFIMGIRPGKPTAQYLKKISGRITLFGAIFLALIALVPAILFKAISPESSGAFTATGMLIVVSVAIEFNTALQSQIMMKNYKGFLK